MFKIQTIQINSTLYRTGGYRTDRMCQLRQLMQNVSQLKLKGKIKAIEVMKQLKEAFI